MKQRYERRKKEIVTHSKRFVTHLLKRKNNFTLTPFREPLFYTFKEIVIQVSYAALLLSWQYIS